MRYPPVLFSVLFLSISARAASWETSSSARPAAAGFVSAPARNWTYRGNDGYYTLKLKAGKVTRIIVQADRD